jgi:EAL domain-containing protein (putative c-di-GMP-specific phosphodiesterase class I)
MDNTLHTQRSLKLLRELDVHLLIDDFGTGYSSLSYLKRFDAHGMKIDKSFIQDLDDPRNSGLIQSLVSMAHTLGMTVTAEGVETLEQYQLLQAVGCDYAQGFFISRPLTVTAARDLLSSTHMGLSVA